MHALEASEKIAEMKSLGAARVVALVKEDIGTEVADFRAGFWSDEVMLDDQKSFYLALGGGKESRTFSVTTFLAMYLNPFSKSRIKDALGKSDKEGVKGNITGEGFINGGVYVIRSDGKAAFAFCEEQMGDMAPVEDVLEGVKAAVRGEVFEMAPMAMEGAAKENRRRTWKEWAGRTDGPDGYVRGDVTRGIAASLKRSRK